MDVKDLLVKALYEKENSRSRSIQKEIGPSELGGCRRKVWYKLNGQQKTNGGELKLAAIMGTAIHDTIEKAFAGNKEVMLEQTVEHNGMKAHVDLYIPGTGDVVDWKTVKLKNLTYFPSQQQRWQVHTYGYLIEQSGLGKATNVHLVAIPRDGDERDVKVYSEKYDTSIALEALSWLEAIKKSEVAPEPEKDESYCKFYCKYFDPSGEIGCVGLKKERTKTELPFIESNESSTQALEYIQIDNRIKELTTHKDAIKEALTGVVGVTATGVEVRWTQVAGPTQVDRDKVQDMLGFVPTIKGKESLRLSIKHSGGK
jgi:CRISPR/Cas system-associated exonuclease Cas4 (RecB family)